MWEIGIRRIWKKKGHAESRRATAKTLPAKLLDSSARALRQVTYVQLEQKPFTPARSDYVAAQSSDCRLDYAVELSLRSRLIIRSKKETGVLATRERGRLFFCESLRIPPRRMEKKKKSHSSTWSRIALPGYGRVSLDSSKTLDMPSVSQLIILALSLGKFKIIGFRRVGKKYRGMTLSWRMSILDF